MATTFKTAVDAAAADVSPLRILTNGNSLVEGEGASTFANTWRQLIAILLRATYGIKGAGLGFIPARPYATSLAASASWRNPGTSGTATTAPNWNITMGLKGVRFTATGQTRQIVLPDGTAFDFVHLQAAGAGGGILNVQLNGGAAVGVNTNDTTPGTEYQPSKLRRFTRPGGRGAMTVLTTATSNAGGVMDGLMHYDGDDVGGGVHMFDCSRTGARSDVVALDDMLNGWASFQPHTIIDDQVGTNDFLDGERAAPNTGAPPATAAARLGLRLDKAQAMASQPTYIVLIPWRLPALAGTIAGRTYQQYIDAVLATIAAHPYAANVKVLDLGAVYPDAASQPWHNADGLHPNDLGHQKIAEAVMGFLGSMDANVGTFAVTLPKVTASILGDSHNVGVLSASTPKVTAAIVGGSTNPGVLAAAVPGVTSQLTGTQTNSGTLAAVLPRVTTQILDQVVNVGVFAATLPAVRVDMVGQSVNPGALEVELARVTAEITGVSTVPGAFDVELPLTTVMIAGTQTNPGVLDARLPRVAVSISGEAQPPVEAGDVEIVSVVERQTRTITITGEPMHLEPQARRWYWLDITTLPGGVSPTDWWASFDGGVTWHRAVDRDGSPAWLVAGPLAEQGAAVVVLAQSTQPRVRLTAGEEIEVELTPFITVA